MIVSDSYHSEDTHCAFSPHAKLFSIKFDDLVFFERDVRSVDISMQRKGIDSGRYARGAVMTTEARDGFVLDWIEGIGDAKVNAAFE